jgi:hypothetical protein
MPKVSEGRVPMFGLNMTITSNNRRRSAEGR